MNNNPQELDKRGSRRKNLAHRAITLRPCAGGNKQAGCDRAPETAPLVSLHNSSEEFTRILASDIARWTEVAKAGNIKMEQ
jgi:hypothetical protein